MQNKELLIFLSAFLSLLFFASFTENASASTPGNLIGKPFPALKGNALSKKEVTLPDDAKGFVTVIIVAFERDTQNQIDTWADTLLKRYDSDNTIKYFEVPMISGFYSFMSGIIDGGMRGGVPKPLHDNVVTFYGDRGPYFEAFGVDDKSKCYLFVLDRDGTVKYKERGYSDYPRLSKLFSVIDDLIKK